MGAHAEHALDRALLDDAAEIHHRDLVGEVLHHREVVRDEEVGEALLALQLAHQVEQLRLHRDVERAGGFVAHDHPRRHRERARHRDALTLTAGELVWIAPAHLRRQPHALEQLDHAGLARAVVGADAERDQALLDDLAHPHARVERGEGVLEHHLHRAPQRLQGLGRQRVVTLAVEP